MTTARTTTAQPIAASISIPDAILHSTAFARRKPLLLLKIVRQTDPRFSPASPGAARQAVGRHRLPRKVRKARPRRLRPRLTVCDEKAARQKGRPDRAGVRRRRKETSRFAGGAQRSVKPLRLCGNGPAAPILSASPAVPYPARHFSATRLIRCRTRLPLPHPTFPFAPDYTLPNAAFFATPLNCRPLRPLGRTRDFPLRTSALRRPRRFCESPLNR